MGSEHYCLRWNNHQSNLLGVFSQLLQDESLVDVTLACSEGASIRAHKVVLSACSSYFQSLFLDHPEKHPIVILKDVRLSELQTLVEFMYKGEVNVQYCQLSALLKTAESLKVKGLAEMTNQNTALREPEREPDRLRPHSQPSKLSPSSCDHHQSLTTMETSTISGNTSSGLLNQQHHNTSTTTNLLGGLSSSSSSTSTALQLTTTTSINNLNVAIKRENDRSSPSPPKRLHTSTSSSPLPLDLYQRRCPSSGIINRSERHRIGIDRDDHDSPISSRRTPINNDEQYSPSGGIGSSIDKERNRQHLHHHQQQQQHLQHHNNSTDDEDNGSNDVGINMTINPNSSSSGNGIGSTTVAGGQSLSSSSQSVVVPPINSSITTSIHSTDLTRPSSRTGGGGNLLNCGSGGVSGGSSITHTATSSRISSPIISTAGSGGGNTEPVAGPSGLGPVQSVPLPRTRQSPALTSIMHESITKDLFNCCYMGLSPFSQHHLLLQSLKKEIDWVRNDDKSTGGSGDTLDYRHLNDSETSESPHGLGGGSGGGIGGSIVSGSVSLEQSGHGYPCMYCGATFPHQSKLTRHILSHSLETLKYRETAAHLLHPGHITNLMQHDLPPLPQHFTHRHGPTSSTLIDSMEPPDGGSSQMELEFSAAAMAAAAAAAATSLSGSGLGSSSGLSGNSSSNILIGSGGSGNSTLSGGNSSTSAAVAAAAALAAGSSTSSDPNSVVLCKFCGKSFPDVASLITHLPVHTGDRPFKCEFCGKAFKLRHHMKDHCRVHTGERPFRCSMCGKTFSRSTILKAHEKTHFPKFVRKFLSTSPVDTKDELPQ